MPSYVKFWKCLPFPKLYVDLHTQTLHLMNGVVSLRSCGVIVNFLCWSTIVRYCAKISAFVFIILTVRVEIILVPGGRSKYYYMPVKQTNGRTQLIRLKMSRIWYAPNILSLIASLRKERGYNNITKLNVLNLNI